VATHVAPETSFFTVYEMIAEPCVVGFFHETSAEVLKATATTDVGFAGAEPPDADAGTKVADPSPAIAMTNPRPTAAQVLKGSLSIAFRI
jgi:hypothetical protein